jgi:hypothetical protein
MRFAIDTAYKKVEIFKSAVEKFVKARPREWFALLFVIAGRIEADLGFVEYAIVVQHREAWQNMGSILNSKHTVNSFCLELAKKLDMRHQPPVLPVDLTMVGNKLPPQFDLNYNLEASSEHAGGVPPKAHGHGTSDSTSLSSKPFDEADLMSVAGMFDDM